MSNSKSSIVNRQSTGSWHHRIARLSFPSDWRPKCQARGCDGAAAFACEYDIMRKGRPAASAKIYCELHAKAFAARHEIDISAAPVVDYYQVDKSDRDTWAFTRETSHG